MKKLLLLIVATMMLSLNAADRPVIILKFDDFGASSCFRNGKLHAHWQTLLDFLHEKGVRKCGFGIIADTMEKDNPKFDAWVKEQHAKGEIEFWCHGYKGARVKQADGNLEPGEYELDFAAQKAALTKCQQLAKKKLGFTFTSFGPHWSGTNADTARALQETGFTSWMYADPKMGTIFKGHIYPRHIGLEHHTFLPNFPEFKKRFDNLKNNKDVLVLQGHPMAWFYNNKKDEPADARYQQFKKIIEYLVAEGCTFETPTGYLEYIKTNPPKHTPKKADITLQKEDFSHFTEGAVLPPEWKEYAFSFEAPGKAATLRIAPVNFGGSGTVAFADIVVKCVSVRGK